MSSKNALMEYLMPDLIIYNGKIVTVDRDFSVAQAVAVKNGIIAAVGSNDDIKAMAGKKTNTINLKGNTMLPGINDSHCHVSDWALTRPPWKLDIRFPVVKSIADIVRMVAEAAGKTRPGDWIQGEGWDQGYLNECLADDARLPSREDLDRVAPANPVVLVEYSGHRMWVNSKALELAGIGRDTPDPVGGRVGRNPKTGECDGLLYEKADVPVREIVPPWTAEQRMKSIPDAMSELNSLGITSFTDAGVDKEKWACYNDAFNRNIKESKWTCRVNMLLHMGDRGKFNLEGMKEAFKYVGCRYNFGNEWLKVGGVKFIGDGIPPLKTAYMFEPYLDGTYGLMETEGNTLQEQEKSLREMITLVHQNRLQVGIHSTGERTIHIITDQYMKCIEQDPWDARHYVIHSDFSRPEDIKKIGNFAKQTGYGIGMNVQSSIKWTISDIMETLVGKGKAAYHWPLRTMLDNGIRVANSSDAPVTYPDWRPGIQGAVLRESKATGRVSGPEQCITVAEAIQTYTINGAWLDHMEDVKGSIEAGKLADFCIIGEDILSIDPHKIKDIPILMTVAGGAVVYNAGKL